MPIIVTVGSADPLVPLSKGDVEAAADVVRGIVLGNDGNQAQLRMIEAVTGTSVRSWVESWASRNSCRPADPAVESGPTVETTAYRDCRAGGDVVLEVIEGGGHDWPASPDATAHALSFFASHPFPIDQLS
jgi:poly(3-hydroxybutyrate) depolymerase